MIEYPKFDTRRYATRPTLEGFWGEPVGDYQGVGQWPGRDIMG